MEVAKFKVSISDHKKLVFLEHVKQDILWDLQFLRRHDTSNKASLKITEDSYDKVSNEIEVLRKLIERSK